MTKLLAVSLTLVALTTHAATPHIQVKTASFSVTLAPTNAQVVLEPLRTVTAITNRSGFTDTSGQITFSNAPAGQYRLLIRGVRDLELNIPDTSGVIEAIDYVTTIGWEPPEAAAGPPPLAGVFRGVPYLWPDSQGDTDSVLKNDGSGGLSWGQGTDLSSVTNVVIAANLWTNKSGELQPVNFGSTVGASNISINLSRAISPDEGLFALEIGHTDWRSVNLLLDNDHKLRFTNQSASAAHLLPDTDREIRLGAAALRYTALYTTEVNAGSGFDLDLWSEANINLNIDNTIFSFDDLGFTPDPGYTLSLGSAVVPWGVVYTSNYVGIGTTTFGGSVAASILQVTNETTHFGLVTNHTTLRSSNIFNGGWVHNTGNFTNQGSLTVTGAVTVPSAGGLKLGTGATITNILSASAHLTFTAVSAQTSQDQVVSVAGTKTNDVATLGIPMQIGQQINCTFTCFASNDNVWVRMNNFSSATRSTNGTFQLLVFQR